MNHFCTYRIQVCGEVTGAEINATSPVHIITEVAGPGSTLLTVATDQSGLLGLIGYLHGMGFVFLSIVRMDQPL